MENQKVGLARQAYVGPPKGVRHVWPEEFNFAPKPHWVWQKQNSQHKLTTKYNLAYLRKRKNIIDNL